jgi:hypothetical protein
LRFAEVKKNLLLAHLRNFINKNPQKHESVSNLNESLNFKNNKKYSCLDSSMVEHLLVIDIIACHFLPIAQYKSLHASEMAGHASSIPGKFFVFIITLLSPKSF